MNKFLSVLALMIMGSSIFAQAQTPQFSLDWFNRYQHTFTNSFSSEVREIAASPNTQDVYVLVDLTSDLDTNGNITGQTYNYVGLLKYDNTGTLIEVKIVDIGQHSNSGFDRKSGFGLYVDASGNVYAAYNKFNNSTGYDVVIAKYNSSLGTIWTNTFTGSGTDIGVDFTVSNTGVAFALVKSTVAPNPSRYRLMKASAQGTSSSSYYSFANLNDHPSSMDLDNSGNAYFTGYRQLNTGAKAILVSSLNVSGTTGNARWTVIDSCGSSTGDDFGRHVVIGPDGFVYITGSSQGTVQHGIDVVTMRFNAVNGKKSWESFLNFTLTDGGYFVDVPDLNTVYVGWKGGNTVYVENLSASAGNPRRRAAYNPVPVSQYNSITGVSLTDMKVSAGKSAYITGTVSGLSASGPFDAPYLAKVNFQGRGGSMIEIQIPVQGTFAASKKSAALALNNVYRRVYHAVDHSETYATHDQESVEISCYTGINTFRKGNQLQVSPNHSQVHLFPNPASTEINVSSDLSIDILKVYNAIGIEVSNLQNELTFDKKSMKVDLRNLPDGIYFINLQLSDGNIRNLRFVKE